MHNRLSCTIQIALALLLSWHNAPRLLAQEPSKSPASQEAEKAVARYYQAFFNQQWTTAAEEMHPEAREVLQRMVLHILRTTDSLKERRASLQEFGGVSTIAAFQKVDTKTVFVRMFQFAWKHMDKDFRDAWKNSRIKVVGSIPEGELYHVVFRTMSKTEDFVFGAVSVATVKQDGGQWKVLTSQEFEKARQNLVR